VALPAPCCSRLRLPTGDRFGREPDYQAPAISQGCIIFAPVRDLMTLAGNVASAFRRKLTWGFPSQGMKISSASVKLQWLFRYPRSEPFSQPGRYRTRSNSHSVAVRDGCTKIPLAADGAQENETILESGFLSHASLRFVHPDPPELIRSWKIRKFGQRLSSSGFHHGSFDDDAGGDIFPQCHQQLARQCDYGRLFMTAAVARDPFFKPQSQRGLRLMAQP